MNFLEIRRHYKLFGTEFDHIENWDINLNFTSTLPQLCPIFFCVFPSRRRLWTPRSALNLRNWWSYRRRAPRTLTEITFARYARSRSSTRIWSTVILSSTVSRGGIWRRRHGRGTYAIWGGGQIWEVFTKKFSQNFQNFSQFQVFNVIESDFDFSFCISIRLISVYCHTTGNIVVCSSEKIFFFKIFSQQAENIILGI